ncbi:MAG: trypsin-like peptidase domain-containing protein [Gemmataceae bacterium]|nr:trypsin-like peptidase domain-containing protein [Gemmataceae bacterium]
MQRVLLLCAIGAGLYFVVAANVRIPLQIGAQTKVSDPLLVVSERFEAVAAKVTPAVVSVEAVKPPKPAQGKNKPVEESGSGVIVKLDGQNGFFVLTNNHVIAQARTDQITIHLADGRVFRPGQVWTDPETDVAILSLDGALNLPHAALGNSETAKVGRWVLAVGSPFGLNQTVTHGIISARDRGQVSLGNAIRIKEFLQTDAAINPGSSGGPLVDLQSEVIGINTAIASHNGSNSGVSFSIPINLVKRVAQQLLNHGAVKRGYLGMQLAGSFDPGEALRLGLDRVQGALVEKVYPNTPAAAAGLQPGDVILQVESISVRSENHLINTISGLPAGQRIRLQVWRQRGTTSLEAVVGDWSKAQAQFQVNP